MARHLLLVPIRPVSFPVALVLERGWGVVHLDVHDLVVRKVAEDGLPCHLGHAHELVRVGSPDEQLDVIVVKVAHLRPEL